MAYHQGLLRQKGFGDYHRGLLRQKGFGLVGSLLKIGGPLVTGALGPVIGEVLGGIVRKKQRGRGIGREVLKHGIGITSNAAIDALDHKGTFAQGLRRHGTQRIKNVGVNIVDRKMRQNLPILRAPIIGSVLNTDAYGQT